MSRDENPSAATRYPVSWNPDNAGARWNQPPSGNPDISATMPAIVAGGPDIVRSRCPADHDVWRSRRSHANHSLRGCVLSCEKSKCNGGSSDNGFHFLVVRMDRVTMLSRAINIVAIQCHSSSPLNVDGQTGSSASAEGRGVSLPLVAESAQYRGGEA